VFENLRRCLAEAGAGFDDVVKLTLFVLDVAGLPAVREARDAVIDPGADRTSRPMSCAGNPISATIGA
jgi:enamine deaminase RidA (YjgF/YER057c/UK114 family)